MNMLLKIVVVAVFVLLAENGLVAETTKDRPNVLHLRQLMTVSEFKDCGLDKLTDEELAKLNSWLQNYTKHVVDAFNKSTSLSSPDVIESHIEGDFEGWEGETIFKLDNGQIWQQSSYDYTYHYAYHPEAGN
ncbi:MAG TPA: hypothetical protein ACFYEK_16055 [Candidatus Wunengus sp. YC60]|uniref:hypothetical protein n=1 Tax=Candidatus Wunengus sp. YC60 TaxID=3367697 RepID=UPI004026AF07